MVLKLKNIECWNLRDSQLDKQNRHTGVATVLFIRVSSPAIKTRDGSVQGRPLDRLRELFQVFGAKWQMLGIEQNGN